ncbi:HTH-type transcriptional regulator/antitoxin HigA [Anseongella ginsenosidimutans]|uniref:HTH-type transcriptional regulator/antitoxin HigA n=1 Tax=Anseongella ginsenosidimutans TaxID=496056 RepID=A0A4R3KNG8_9SPHI|nr:transcriptional regulator [Anseongella ginsenosidimutans]QEC52416.1 transcriptional regulator [Anseongella ginsenosidimutans]TCS85840.1 HTH-type transcriptional regulator/antitoxin HigA [Anseongella ginsenosidimutans]
MLNPIKNKDEYEDALAQTYSLMQKDIRSDSKESDELEVLSILIKEYENKWYPVPRANPLEAIKFRMDQMNLSESELSSILGYRSRKSEILSGKRKLSLAMIRKLTETLRIPAEVLIQAY